jgi:hypothetical protein
MENQLVKGYFSSIIYTSAVYGNHKFVLKVICCSYFDETNFKKTDLGALILYILPYRKRLSAVPQAAASHSIARCNHGIDQIGISNEFTVPIISIIPT